jgi:hypothetical protein
LFDGSAAGHGTNDFDDNNHVEANVNVKAYLHVKAGNIIFGNFKCNFNHAFDRDIHVEADS